MPTDTAEQKADYIRALLEERRGCVGRDDREARLEAIDAELTRMGHRAATPRARAETREQKTPAPPVAPADGMKKETHR